MTLTIKDHDKVNLCHGIISKFIVSIGLLFEFFVLVWFVVFWGGVIFRVYRKKNEPEFRKFLKVIQWLFPTENFNLIENVKL